MNINELTPENSALVLIDHQPYVVLQIESHERGSVVRNTATLAKIAKALGVPAVLSTIGAKTQPLADPLFNEIQSVFPEIEPIDRSNMNAWADEAFVEAVKATGRKKLVIAGVWTGVCLALTALSALKAGYEVYFVSDCSGDVSLEAHEDAKARMVQAGAHPLTLMSAASEWAPDNRAPEMQSLYGIMMQHGTGVGIMADYATAQIVSGRVKVTPRV